MTMKYKPYPAYKDSGVEWLGEVPVHWEVKRLRFVAYLNPSRSEAAAIDRNTEVSFLPMEAIGDDGSLNLERTRPVGEVESGYTYFREGDVTIAKITPCFENGKGAIMRGLWGEIGFGTTELIVVRPQVNKTTNVYLHWLFLSTPFRKLGESSMYGAGGQKRVPDDFIRNFTTAFPPLPEQQTIATFLDRETAKIDTFIAKQEHLIELLQEKRTALISHAVTKGLNPDAPMKDSGVEWLGEVPAHWEVKPIKYVSTCNNEVLSESTKSDYEIEYVDISSVDEVHGITSTQKMTFSNAPSRARRVVRDGDIIVSTVRTYLRAITSIHNPSDNLIVSTGFAVIRPSIMLNVHFSHYLFKASYLVDEVIARSVGVSYPAINSSELIAIKIGFPSLDEQSAIAAFLDRETTKIDTLIQKARHAIDLLKERRTALISAAVTGKIDVRDEVYSNSLK